MKLSEFVVTSSNEMDGAAIAINASYTFVGPAAGSARLAYDDVFSQRAPPYGCPKSEYTSTENTYNLFKDNPGVVPARQERAVSLRGDQFEERLGARFRRLPAG